MDDRVHLDDDVGMEEVDVVRRLGAIEFEITEPVAKGSGGTAVEVIRAALAEARARTPDVQNAWPLPDPFHQRLFVALCTRYGLPVFRRPKTRTFTVVVPAPSAFMHDVFEPLFERMSEVIDEWLLECTEDVLGGFAALLPAERKEL